MRGIKKFFQSRDIAIFPLLEEISFFRFSFLKNDIIAAMLVAFLAIPQAIAYSLLAGVPAKAGFFSAIFGVIFTASFASSRYLIGGPTTGVSVLIQTAIAEALREFGPLSGIEREMAAIHILNQIVLMVGLLQLTFSLFNLGKLLEFVSRPVILGYFAGVVIAIAVTQVFYFTGVSSASGSNAVIYKAWFFCTHLKDVNIITLFLGLFSLFLLIFLRKLKKLPISLLVIVVAAIISYLLIKMGVNIPTLKDMDSESVLKMTFSLPTIDFELIGSLFPSILAIALLAILEVGSVARGLAAKSGEKMSNTQEIFAVGFSNLFLSFLPTALPSSGSYTKSFFNWQSGAKSKFAALLSGVFIWIVIFFLWPFVRQIPLTALAAILFAMLPLIIDKDEVKLVLVSTKGDKIAFLLTVLSCILFSLDIAFFIGIMISIAFYLKKASVPHLVEYAFNSAGRLIIIAPQSKVKRDVRIIGIAGELFFAAVDLFENSVRAIAEDPHVKVIVLRLYGVYHVDASMCFTLLKLHEYLKATNRELIISGITEEVWHIFYKTKLIDKIGKEHFFLTDEENPQLSTWKAYVFAEEVVSNKS
jgi:SulP family sulfate permease